MSVSRVTVTRLSGHVLDATEDELRELIAIMDEYPSVSTWLAVWAGGGENLIIADAHNKMETVPATPSAVIAYFKIVFGESFR